ncbi:MAG: hypothetical protein IPK79_07240 [Vampirovibrionales bacterium]|nr:hypothetical protein [Vampirovibrionales bacterium]
MGVIMIQRQWGSVQTRTAHRALTFLAAVLVVTGALSAHGETTGLRRIAFTSGVGVTGIDIHSGAMLPTRTIQESDDKIIVEIDGVNANDPVQTDFSRARNVSNVIFQPQSAQRLRVIIRGANLGKAQTRFLSDPPERASMAAPVQPLTQAASVSTIPASSAVIAANASSQEAQTLLSLDTPMTQTPAQPSAAMETAAVNAPFQTAEPAPAAMPQAADPIAGWGDPASWARGVASGEWTPILIKGIIILGLLAGFALFIRQKILNNALPVAEAPRDRRARRDVSSDDDDASGQDDPQRDPGRPSLFSPNRHPKKANAWATRPESRAAQEMPIGLSGMRPRASASQPAAMPPASDFSRPEARFDNRPDTRPGLDSQVQASATTSRVAPPPGRQAIHQYKRQQGGPAAGKPAAASRNQNPVAPPLRKPAASSAALNPNARRDNVKAPPAPEARSNARPGVRPQAMAGRPPQLQTRPNARNMGSETIPENTQVLEFLKNVADLMEKNGEGEKARRIQKNLRP